MGCGASTIPIPTGASTPIDHASNINNNNNKGQDNLNLKRVPNGTATIPNGGQIRGTFQGVYGGFRNNSVAPSPISVQQQLQLQPNSQQQQQQLNTVTTLGDDELSAIEEVIFEQHKSTRKSAVKFQPRPLSSIQESPSSIEEEISSNQHHQHHHMSGNSVDMVNEKHSKSPWTQRSHSEDPSYPRKRSSVAIQTDHRSPASLIRLKSKKTQTDHELFPEDELEVLLNKAVVDGRLIDAKSSSLYSSDEFNTGRESGDSSILTHNKGNFIKQLSQTQRLIAPPVASFISSSVLLQNKRGSCDAIVQVKLICTFDQAIQTVLSLIAPSKSLANDDVDSLNHSSLDSSQLISPAISPSPEPVNSPQDIESTHGHLVNSLNEKLGDTTQVTTSTTTTNKANNKSNNNTINNVNSVSEKLKSDVVTVDAKDERLNEETNERKDYTSNSDATNDENNTTTMTPIGSTLTANKSGKVKIEKETEQEDENNETKDTLFIAQAGHSNVLNSTHMNTLDSDNESPHYILSNIKSGQEDMDDAKVASVRGETFELTEEDARDAEDEFNEQFNHKVTLESDQVEEESGNYSKQQPNELQTENESPVTRKGEKRTRSGDRSSLGSETFYKETSCDSSSGHLRDRGNQSPFAAGGQANSSSNFTIERRDASVQAGSPCPSALSMELNGSRLLNAPRPPACKKRQMIPSIQVFKEIDQRILLESEEASNSPSFASSDHLRTIDSLVKYLCRDLGNDLFKVRAIFRWITCNINYDANCTPVEYASGNSTYGGSIMNTSVDGSSQSLDEIINTKLASSCTDFCKLFIEMCKVVSVTAVKITGLAKGFSYRPGYWLEIGHDALHTWCAVNLFGSWRFIDPTWGTGYTDHSGNFIKKCNEFFFLTDPDELIWSHFPLKGPDDSYTSSSTWQLIDQPITLEEFNSLPKVTPYFFECNFKLRSKLGNESTSGCIEFRIQTEIKIQSHEPMRYKFKLFPIDQLENSSMNHFVFCQLKEDRTLGSFTLSPPSEGKYYFKIFASPEREMLQGSTSLHLVAVFIINCTRARKYLQPFPLNELPWGLTQAFYDFKLRLASSNQSGPVISTWGGKRRVAIESPEVLLVSHQLFDSDGCELDIRSCILKEETFNKDNSMRITFTIAPPRIGTFKFSIFGMPRPKQKGKWRLPLLATFLIDCKLVKSGPGDEDPPLNETVKNSSRTDLSVIASSSTASSTSSLNPQPSTSNKKNS